MNFKVEAYYKGLKSNVSYDFKHKWFYYYIKILLCKEKTFWNDADYNKNS